MRVNIYAEEIIDRLEVVMAIAENTGSHFYGIRFYLESSDKLFPPKHPDDDSSAVTFWIKSKKDGYKQGDELFLAELLRKASNLIERELTDKWL